MKRIFFPLAIVCFLNGCVLSPTINQQQNEFGDKPYRAENGKTLTVNGLRDDYKKQTGMNLIGPDTRSCGWNETCYQNAWAAAYDEDLGAFNYKKRLEEKRLEESKCSANPDCKRDKDLSSSMSNLSANYTALVYTNQYQQAEYDYIAREICSNSERAQKKGVMKSDLVNKIRDLPGVAPMERVYITRIASECWNISSLGGDWKKALRR